MKIFVTGGSGYCGARMVPQLLDLGYEVTVYDTCFFGSDFLPLDNSKFHLIKGDIRDTALIERSCLEHDVFLNLACISNDASFELDEALSTSVNLDAFLPMVQAAKRSGVKRFIYACCAKIFNENYHDSIHADECTVELRRTTIKTWYKSNMPSRAAGGKIGKPKHNTKVHLWGGISNRGLTDLVIFEGKMNSAGFQDILTVGLIPFLENYPEGHRFFQDGDPKHTSNETKNFMTIHGINNYPMPPESPV
jgi:hypothetical protein